MFTLISTIFQTFQLEGELESVNIKTFVEIDQNKYKAE